MAAWYQLGQDTGYPAVSFSSWTKSDTGVLYPGAGTGPQVTVNTHVNVQANHSNIAFEVARDAITLLKNDGNLLPLKTSDVIRVFGSDAGPNPSGMNGCTDRSCDQGVMAMVGSKKHGMRIHVTGTDFGVGMGIWHCRLSIL